MSVHTHDVPFRRRSNPVAGWLPNRSCIPSCDTIWTISVSFPSSRSPRLSQRNCSLPWAASFKSPKASFPKKDISQSLSAEGSPKRRYSPTLSRMVQQVFPGQGRRPRPTICKYLANDNVGRASCTNSTSGQSKPSEKRSTLTSTCMTPEGGPPAAVLRNERMISSRCRAGVRELMATASTPRWR